MLAQLLWAVCAAYFGNSSNFWEVILDVVRCGFYWWTGYSLCFGGTSFTILLQYGFMLLDHIYFNFGLCTGMEASGSYYVPEPYVSPTRHTRWARRHRRRKPPFYKRRQRYLIQIRQQMTKQREMDEFDSFDFCDRGAFWRNLHNTGDYIASGFDSLCLINPDLMTLFGCEAKFHIGASRPTTTAEFALHVGNDVVMDLTKLSDAGHIFRFQSVYHAENIGGKPIIFDSGASISITPDKSDFIKFQENTNGTTLAGITSSAVCQGKGTIKFTVLDDNGSKKEIITEALYVPEAKVKLLSVQRYCRNVKHRARFSIDGDRCIFEFPTTQGGGKLTFDLESNNMLPQTSPIKQWARKIVRKKENIRVSAKLGEPKSRNICTIFYFLS